ncbi:MAG: chromate resistance protein [Betaproteobacteria bacterium]|nr:chromate resistance protein [Betaproteobacteria bacterium]
MNWLCFITSLPTENATLRQRAWRALKSSGASVLRDGVYLLPDLLGNRTLLDGIAQDVLSGGGTAMVLDTVGPSGGDFKSLFNRSEEYAALLAELGKAAGELTPVSAPNVLKQARKLRKTFDQLNQIDFFPGQERAQTESALVELEGDCARLMSPDEPHAASGAISALSIADYQGRTWATRAKPWVDRLATAWLIRRFIDPQSRILWLMSPKDCPNDALGFDFDGATFSHIGSRVTFEVVAASFGLTDAAINRLGLLVHYLDVGGVQPPEAVGVEAALEGLSSTITDDDQLLALASGIFDGLLTTFQKPTAKGAKP